MKRLVTVIKTCIAITALVVVSACGGGGGGGSTTLAPQQIQAGEIQSGVVVVPANEAAAMSLAPVTNQADTLVVSNPTGVLANVQTGQIVSLPANDAQGIPLGLTAKVVKNPDGSVTLTPALMGDVFKKLKIDFDSARDGATIAGLIRPTNGTMTLSQAAINPQQTGLEYAACQLGLTLSSTVACKNGALVGSIELAQKVKVRKKGSTETVDATFYGTIDISKVSTQVKIDYDSAAYPATGGFNQAMVKLTGEWGAKVGIRLDDETTKVEIPSFSELIRADGSNIWDENTKIKFGKYFELSGLNGDDKKGLIPLGGFYLTPAGTAPFTGDLSAGQLGQIKTAAVVVWIYIDMSGNLTLSGDLSLLKFNGAYIEKGFDITRVNGELKTREINVKTTPATYAPYLKGGIELSQNAGLAVAADLLVGGIRPFTLKAEVVGVKYTGKLEGEGGYRLSPDPQGLVGNLCVNSQIDVYSDLIIKGRINAKLDAGWLSTSVGAEQTWGPWTATWWSKTDALCVNTYTLPLSLAVAGADETDPTKTKIEGNFVSTFNNPAIRNQVGIWRLYEDGPLQSTWIDVDSSFGGTFTLRRAPGNYSYKLAALHKDYKDTGGQPLVVVASDLVAVTVRAVPIVNFTASLNNNDCKSLLLTSNSSAAAGIVNYAWAVTPSGGTTVNQSGSNMSSSSFTLQACGTVAAQLKVTDAAGASTTLSKSVDTTAMAPRVTVITPVAATINVATAYTVAGQNLPLTAVMSLADGTCQTPTARTSAGFTVLCTAGGIAGNKVATIKTDTTANSGAIIDATKSIAVSAASTATGKLPDTGITASQCYAAGSNVLASCTSAAAIALNNQQDGMVGRDVTNNDNTDGKAGFSYSVVPDPSGIAGLNFAKTSCVKDNITGLVWEGKAADGGYRDYRKTYTNYGDGRAGDASAYVAAVNVAGLCGATDWRLPTADELQGIVDYGVAYPGPTVDATWFPNTQGNYFWSSSPYVGVAYVAWSVSFGDGSVDGNNRDNTLYVRLVRAGQ